MPQEKRLTMKDLPENERPYEKLERFGPEALSDSELLSILLRSGTRSERVTEVAQRALVTAQEHNPADPLSALLLMPLEELSGLRGIGRVHAIQLIYAKDSRLNDEQVFSINIGTICYIAGDLVR